MAENNLFNNEDLKTLNEENKINDEKFQEFHKKVFDEMMEQALFWRVTFKKKIGSDQVLEILILNL